MDFNKKMKIRLWNAILCCLAGIAVCIVSYFTNADNFFSSFGLAMTVCGIVRLRNYFLITKNEETIKKQRIAESDERNISISEKAKSWVFTIYNCLCGAGVIIFQLLNEKNIANFLAMSVCTMLILYCIIYWIIRKKS